MGSRLFVGLGSPHGDDCVGWIVADRLRTLISDGVVIRKAASPAELLDWIDGVDRLVICDACAGSGGAPGGAFHWTWPKLPFEALRHGGSHNMSLSDVLELAHRLERLPRIVEVWGIEVARCEPGTTLSPGLNSSIADVARDIAESLNDA